jgi:tetratricopeptide (TPR) repeat protein
MGVLWLLLSVAGVYAQDTQEARWETATTTGVKAFEQGHYPAAARQFQAALAIAQEWQADDPRLATSLMNMAIVYHTQGQYEQAAPLYQRTLTLQEQLFGAHHPQLVPVLKAYADVQRRLSPLQSLLPWSAANKLAARARYIQRREEGSDDRAASDGWFGPGIPIELGDSP